MDQIGPTSAYDNLGLTNFPGQNNNELGQDDFLNLMIAQLKNQDPTSPMESGEFLGQLAQFGTVSGLDKLNESFSALAGSLVSGQSLQAAGLVGRDVLVPSDEGYISMDGSLRGAVDVPFDSSQVLVTIENQAGEVIKIINLGASEAGLTQFDWDGMDSNGVHVPEGTYNVSVSVQDATGVVATEALIYARVESVTFGVFGEPMTLGLEGLNNVVFDLVRQIG